MVTLLLLPSWQGCITVGPDYENASPDVPANWNEKTEITGQSIEPSRWWERFHDEHLNALMQQARDKNLTLAQARTSILASRASLGIEESANWPSIDASGSATSTATKNNYTAEDQIPTTTQQALDNELARKERAKTTNGKRYSASLDASWEIDLFGGRRRAIEAATADLENVEAQYNDALVSLMAEVALNYIQSLAYKERIRIANENLARQSEALQLVQWRFEAGLASELELHQAKLNVQTTKASLPPLQTNLKISMNALSVLLAEPPGGLESRLSGIQAIPETSADIFAGIPADVIRRRPDVRAAERALAASVARIGAAKAELFPTFYIPGSVGIDALSADQFKTGNARSSSIGLGFRWNIFDAGAIRRNVALKDALAEKARQNYRQVVLEALQEVENAIVSCALQKERIRELESAEKSAGEAAELTMLQYRSGLLDFESVLNAQQRLLSTQDSLVSARAEQMSNVVRLFKSLGGGW